MDLGRLFPARAAGRFLGLQSAVPALREPQLVPRVGPGRQQRIPRFEDRLIPTSWPLYLFWPARSAGRRLFWVERDSEV